MGDLSDASRRDTPAAGSASDGKRELAAELRRLKESSALSFARLAAKTYISKSSLERYLNGKLTPPKQLVVAIGEACDGDIEHLLALWYRATTDTTDSTAESTSGEGSSKSGPARRRFVPVPTWVAVAFPLVAIALAAAWLYKPLAMPASPASGAGPIDPSTCTYPFVCFFDTGRTGSFQDYTEDWQALRNSRGAKLMVNTRRDDVVWLRWADGVVECTDPGTIYQLTTTPPVDGIRIARDSSCGPAARRNFRAIPVVRP